MWRGFLFIFASMKAKAFAIGLFLLALFSACHRPLKIPEPAEMPSPELLTVDSLMWQQPDSALACLVSCFDACTTTEYNRHYANLLLSELLYKNDYAQTNRPELQQAVAYFDSLVGEAPPLQRGSGGFKTRPNQIDQTPFLAARAHYINGVGYYENDSAVQACTEYLKALEIMEGRFEEKELVGKKAKFMALTYTHLEGLFSDYYLHEQALYFGKMALKYYRKYDATPWHIAWILEEMGAHYDMMDNYDSAGFYYHKSLMVLPDTNNLTFRDIATHIAFLSYKTGKSPMSSLNHLRQLSVQSVTKKELLSRFAIVGEIYYHEKQFDSALVYLSNVFRFTHSIGSKKQAAEWLVEICKVQGREKELIDYAEFLVPFATQDEYKGVVKSQLAELCNGYKQFELEQQHKKKVKKQTELSIGLFAGLLMVMLGVFVLYWKNKRKQQNLETQIKEEQYAHEIKQRALSGRLRRSNEALRMQKEETSNLAKEIDIQQRQTAWNGLDDFMNESICKDILTALNDKQIKREAKSIDYPELRLSDVQLHDLSIAVEKHFCGFEKTLTDLYPKINRNALNQCLLYLLNVEDVQIAALLSCDYSTVKRRSAKLKEAFNTEKEVRQFIRELVL